MRPSFLIIPLIVANISSAYSVSKVSVNSDKDTNCACFDASTKLCPKSPSKLNPFTLPVFIYSLQTASLFTLAITIQLPFGYDNPYAFDLSALGSATNHDSTIEISSIAASCSNVAELLCWRCKNNWAAFSITASSNTISYSSPVTSSIRGISLFGINTGPNNKRFSLFTSANSILCCLDK